MRVSSQNSPSTGIVASFFLFCCFLVPDYQAQEEGSSEMSTAATGNIPVKIVGGRLVARAELTTIAGRVPANLFIEFESDCGLLLHDSAAQALEAENDYGVRNEITIAFPEFSITEPGREKGPENAYSEFTRLYSSQINEEALVGTIGARILSRYQVTFDLGEGRLELAFPEKGGNEGDDDEDTPPDEDELAVGITMREDVVILPVQDTNGKVHGLALTTSGYDTVLDKSWCAEMSAPDGAVGPLRLEKLDLGKFVAFRPSEAAFADPDGVIGTLGLNLLKHLRLTIDRTNRIATCNVTSPPEFPVSDREFFSAMTVGDADQLEACLEKFPKERLSQEASQMLLELRIREGASSEKIETAIRRLSATWSDDMVSTKALGLMRGLLKAGRPMLAVFAGERGLEGGRKDRNPNSIHQLHSSIGEILLDNGEIKRAWRHLLSAAFGVPDDGAVNLNLGRVYEEQGRYNRALSRYVQAVIQAETGEKALEGLERVQKKMGSTQSLSVDTIAPLIAGKTYNYGAATQYRPDEEETNRVSLVEFFTNAHFKEPTREAGAIGGALGNEGVMTFFPRDKVAMLSYHLVHPDLDFDSLTNEFSQRTAEFYGVPPAAHVIDGTKSFPGQGHLSDAEAIFQEGREKVLDSLQEPSDYELELTSAIEGDTLVGTLVVKHIKGEAELSAIVQIVMAERGVLYPGKSKVVIQRMVARAALTDSYQGVPLKLENGAMTLPFSKSLSEVSRENLDYMKRMGAGKAQSFAAKMDPRQLTVVAFVRDGESKRILQAIQINPANPEEDESNQ